MKFHGSSKEFDYQKKLPNQCKLGQVDEKKC